MSPVVLTPFVPFRGLQDAHVGQQRRDAGHAVIRHALQDPGCQLVDLGCDVHTHAHAREGLQNIFLEQMGTSWGLYNLLLAGARAWIITAQDLQSGHGPVDLSPGDAARLLLLAGSSSSSSSNNNNNNNSSSSIMIMIMIMIMTIMFY